ncbi:hypothetical protein [Butyrivibrio sp. AE2032]|uniref:hypothetical protein n=1 Tax=Butyrivibrio sp. AE2032 TaxID=1458463 RepID=UPI0005517958|nr:hypothetical protein [Butyrivibrio sp. AE2032]
METKREKSWLSALIIGLCVTASCVALAFGLSHFRSESVHTIAATGGANVDFAHLQTVQTVQQLTVLATEQTEQMVQLATEQTEQMVQLATAA